eukprot:c16074_g1_i2 orf=251-2725(+)
MESCPIVQNISHSIQVMGMLAEKAIFYKSSCQAFAAAINLLKAPFKELQDSKTPLSIEELSIFNMLELTCFKLKELLESCGGRASKSILVLRKQQVFQELSLKLQTLLKSLPLDTLSLSEHFKDQVQDCLKALESADFHADVTEEQLSEEVGKALAGIKKGTKMSHGMLLDLAGKLDLKSNQEILREASLLEKEKNIAHLNKNKGEEELLNLLIVLVTQMGDDLAEQKQLQAQEGRMVIPADFRCPLSLELMSDPVIVASGQTYERAYIQQWLDQGNTTCPKSRQELNHFTLISNFTVKALIANWCEHNDIPLPEPGKLQTPPTQPLPTQMSSPDNVLMPAAQPLPTQISSPIQRSLLGAVSTSNNDPAVPLSGNRPRSVRTIPRRREELDTSRETGSDVGSLDEIRGFLHCNSSVAVVERLDIHSPLAQEGENFTDDTVSHSRNTSTSSHGSSLDDTSTATNTETNLRVSNDFSPYGSDVSGEFNRQLRLESIASRNEQYGLVSRSRQTSNVGLQSAADMVGDDEDGLRSRVLDLVRDLESSLQDVQRNAATELRLLAKYNVENRIIIANSGAIQPLVSLLHSTDPQIQENAVTALLNLSINNNNKSEIAAANAIGPLVHVLNVGTSEARENAAATLFSLSVMDENKMTIGQSGAIDPLVDLLMHGTPRGKKDAATALFNLSILHENKVRIVRAKAVKPLMKLMSDPAAGMVDKAVAVVANLATIQEGRTSISEEEGIPVLVEVVEMGSQRGKENAAAALLHLCTNSNKFRSRVLQEGVIPPLVALTKSGTPRAKEKASALLRLFREQRHGRGGADMHGDRRR